jgi:hypothetical protein
MQATKNSVTTLSQDGAENANIVPLHLKLQIIHFCGVKIKQKLSSGPDTA